MRRVWHAWHNSLAARAQLAHLGQVAHKLRMRRALETAPRASRLGAAALLRGIGAQSKSQQFAMGAVRMGAQARLERACGLRAIADADAERMLRAAGRRRKPEPYLTSSLLIPQAAVSAAVALRVGVSGEAAVAKADES